LRRGVAVLSDQKPWRVFAEAEVADETGPGRGTYKRCPHKPATHAHTNPRTRPRSRSHPRSLPIPSPNILTKHLRLRGESLEGVLEGPLRRGVAVLSDQKPWRVFAAAEVMDETGPGRGTCKRSPANPHPSPHPLKSLTTLRLRLKQFNPN
jgi:hypothetical protein